MTHWDSLPGRYGTVKKRRHDLLQGSCSFVIPGRLAALNDYTKSNRAGQFIGAGVKVKQERIVTKAIIEAELPHFVGKVHIDIEWYEESKRRDFDNIAFAKKFIFDSLVNAGVLDGDSWRYLSAPEPFRDRFYIDKSNPRIVVTIVSERSAMDE